MFFGGLFGEIVVYAAPGSTPFLFARPVMEELKLTVNRRLPSTKAPDGKDAVGSPSSRALSDTTFSTCSRTTTTPHPITEPAHTLAPTDLQVTPEKSPFTARDFLEGVCQFDDDDNHAPADEERACYDEPSPEDIAITQRSDKFYRQCLYNVQNAQSTLRADLRKSATMQRAPAKTWEVYAGEARLTKGCLRRGFSASAFAHAAGWGFDLEGGAVMLRAAIQATKRAFVDRFACYQRPGNRARAPASKAATVADVARTTRRSSPLRCWMPCSCPNCWTPRSMRQESQPSRLPRMPTATKIRNTRLHNPTFPTKPNSKTSNVANFFRSTVPTS